MPVGADAHRWSTFSGERTLVIAARTVTSTVRVLETLPSLLRGDSRVTVIFAYDPTSAFNAGVLELLRDAGCRVMPWEQLESSSPDLILSASENIEVPEGNCPVLVLPHGVGFQKFVPDSRSSGERLSGAVADSLLETGRAWLAVSHPAQEEQLLAVHPKAAGHTLLVGDPCFDELVGSQPRRVMYREALGVAEHQRLVMVSSTWGPTSLLGRHPDLPQRLLAQLPCDEYRVGVIVHPNVWAAHGAWQIRTLYAAALDAGLLLMPAVHAWRPALVAADVLVGDHGSVTLYGASAGIPLLLAAFGSDSVPGTAVHELSALAPRLDLRGDLLRQVDDVVRGHTPQQYAAVADQAFAERGHALARLRTVLYRLLQLPEPASPPPSALMLTAADPPVSQVTSWQVTTLVAGEREEVSVVLSRIPAAVCGFDEARPGPPGSFAHLACTTDERDRRLAESASVLVRSRCSATPVEALRWIRDTLAELPGSLLAASAVRQGVCLVGLRDGRVVEASATGPAGDPGLPAAVVYACLRAGHPLNGSRVTLRVGGVREEDIVLRLRPVLAAR
ncbi:hypothetical protein ACIPSJ_27450 [Streptomyces sp. NPDC090088]|uniref:hypothetical protein n=1 Tax=Streptomyces sp. NPDC090088 TaxID=3365944 RepID=UPI003810946F